MNRTHESSSSQPAGCRQSEWKKNFAIIRDHFLNQLIEGSYKKRDIMEQMRKLRINLTSNLQAIVMMEILDTSGSHNRKSPAREELIDFAVANIAEELTANHPNILFFKNAERKSILVFAHENERKLKLLIHDICKKIMAAVYQCMKIKVCVLVGKFVREIKDWEVSYRSVLEAKKHQFFLESREFIYGEELIRREKVEDLPLSQKVEKLVFTIKSCQKEEMLPIIQGLFTDLRKSGNEKAMLLWIIQKMIWSVQNSLEEYLPDKIMKYDEESTILPESFQYLCDVEKWFREYCEGLISDIADKRAGTNMKQAALAMDYIEKNYMDANMSLTMICKYLGVSISYFCSFFKHATNITFTEALTGIRISRAKELFETSDRKSNEVAILVGYQDPHYFSAIFKKHVGMTPKEYAGKFRKNS